LLENSGDIQNFWCHCAVAPDDLVDKKLDFLVDELAHYGIAVVGIQETKWFGSLYY